MIPLNSQESINLLSRLARIGSNSRKCIIESSYDGGRNAHSHMDACENLLMRAQSWVGVRLSPVRRSLTLMPRTTGAFLPSAKLQLYEALAATAPRSSLRSVQEIPTPRKAFDAKSPSAPGHTISVIGQGPLCFACIIKLSGGLGRDRNPSHEMWVIQFHHVCLWVKCKGNGSFSVDRGLPAPETETDHH